MLAAFLTTILFSISAVCAQRTSRALGGAAANLSRLILAALVLGAWAHTQGYGFGGVGLEWFLWSGAVGFGIGDTALYQALPRIGSRLSILLVHCLAAPFAATTEWLWLNTRMSGLQIFSAVLILSGVALALAPGRHLQISRRMFWSGVAFGIMAAIGQGLGAVLSRRAYDVIREADQRMDGLTAAYQRILPGIVVALVVWLLVKGKNREPTGSPARSTIWPWVLMNALSGPALGVGCYQWALSQRGTGIVLPIVALTPLVIIPFSRYVEGEKPRKRSLAGGAIAVMGVFILAGGLQIFHR